MAVKAKKHLHYDVELTNCPRCGGDHEGERQKDKQGKTIPGTGSLVFTPLSNPEGRDDLWAFCEVANEPVLLSTEDISG